VTGDPQQTVLLHQAMPFAQVLGAQVVEASPELVRAFVEWDQTRCTAGGVLHGGVLMGLADAWGGFASFLNLPGGSSGTTTLESKTNLFKAVRSGAVTAEARPLHTGRSTIVVDTVLRDDDGALVARTTQTQMVLWPR
jgi:uncharacterized protein (TIGR00369 family)